MATEVGKGYVEILPDTKKFGPQLEKDVNKSATTAASKAGTAATGGFKKAGADAASAFGLGFSGPLIAVTAAVAATKFAVNAASNLQEAVSKSDAVFRKNAGEVQAWAKTASAAFGQSQAQALEAAGTFGNLFQAFGVGLEPATEMSMTLTELASDLASFNNTSVQEAIEAIRSGLSGETEPLKRYGVALTDARLKQEALGLGLIKDVKAPLDAAAKSQAAYSLIMKDTVLAQGDFERTADGYANTMRTLQATVTDAAAALGAELLPTLAELASLAADGIDLVVTVKTQVDQVDNFLDSAGLGAWTDAANRALNPVAQLSHGVQVLQGWFGSSSAAAVNAASANDMLASSKGRASMAAQALAAVQAAEIATVGGMVAAKGREQAANQAVAASIQAQNDALQANINMQLAAIDSTFAVTAANNSFLTAVEAASSAVDDSSTAVNEQQVALDGATQAAITAAAASVRLAQDEAALHDKTLTAKQGNDIMIGSLMRLASQASGPTAAAIGAVISKLQETAKQHPSPTISATDRATPTINNVRSSLDNLNGRSATVALRAIFEGGAAMSEANRFLNIARQARAIGLPAGAEGFRNFAGGLALVGEEGPEIVRLPRGADVYTNQQSMAMATHAAASGVSQSQTIVITGNTIVGPDEATITRWLNSTIAKARGNGVQFKAA